MYKNSFNVDLFPKNDTTKNHVQEFLQRCFIPQEWHHKKL